MDTQILDTEVAAQTPVFAPMTLAELALVGGGDSTAFNMY